MGRLGERLAPHKVIGLDTSVFIYHLEAHPVYQPLTRELLAGVEEGRWEACTSTVTVMELTVRPWRLDRPAVARMYEALLVHFPHLTLRDITRDVARQAARLRALHRLGPADALQIAAALVYGATAWVTHDRPLARLSSLVDVVMLSDLASS